MLLKSYALRIPTGEFSVTISSPAGWFQMVIVYHDGGLTVHHVGTVQDTDSEKTDTNHTQSSGRMVIGRKSVIVRDFYTSVVVDELTLWNRSLRTEDIQNMY